MAWNEPGKPPGNRNPWGKRPGQGQSDLDEVIRNFKKKWGTLFGGGTGSTGSGANFGRLVLSLIIAVVVTLWLSTGVYQVDANQRAVITRFGKVERTAQPGRGMHLPWPVEAAQLVSVASTDLKSEQIRMLTRDEGLVDLVFTLKFHCVDPVDCAFNVRDPETTLREVSESTLRETIGQSSLNDVLHSGSQIIATHAQALMQKTVDSYHLGIDISSVELKEVKVPAKVAEAYQDAEKARADKDARIASAHTFASDIIPKAKGKAASTLQEAEGYKAQHIAVATGEAERFLKILPEYQRAPAITRDRMYLETLESIYASSKKVFVDTRGNGNMIYLPLDKMLESRNDATDNNSATTRTVVVEGSNSNNGARARGTR